jgi:hypothetical protein
MRNFVLSLLLLVSGAAFAPAALAQERAVSAADAKAIEMVIRAQLDAFAHDDADKAFSYAAPGIRNVFGSAANFISMVKKGYPVVYRPASVIFLKPVPDDDAVIQPVRMTDADGRIWIAVYLMERQAAGGWLTNGCQLGRSEGQVT